MSASDINATYGQGPFRPLYIKPKTCQGCVSYRSKYDYIHPLSSRLYIDFDEMTVEVYPRHGVATKQNIHFEVA